MSYSIRYWRPGLSEAAGLLIIANESEFPVYRARLEAAGYVVSDTPAKPPFAVSAGKAS
jgi:hypothetical protein